MGGSIFGGEGWGATHAVYRTNLTGASGEDGCEICDCFIDFLHIPLRSTS